MKEWRFSSTHT